MINRILHFLLLLPLVFSMSACTDDDQGLSQQIVGAWQLTSVNIDGQQQDLSGNNQIILFESNSVFKRYLTDEAKYRIGGWSIKPDMLNISLDLPAAYYIEQIEHTSLTLKRFDFDVNGNLKTTVFVYKKVSEDLLP
jgi:hypothetical protein